MTRYLITTALFITFITVLVTFLTVQQSQAQSLYMSESSLGLSGGFGVESGSANFSGTSFNLGYSLNRNVDFMVAYDRFSQQDFNGNFTDLAGTVVFYPKKQWEDDLITMDIFFTGANSTAPTREGFSATLGSAVSTQLDVNSITSFHPRAGFLFVPYQPGANSHYTAMTFDTSMTFKVAPGVKFLVRPEYRHEFGERTSNFALMGGIVL